jgi:hypothetical protein
MLRMRIRRVIHLLAHNAAITRQRAAAGRGRRVKGKDEHHWMIISRLSARGFWLWALEPKA